MRCFANLQIFKKIEVLSWIIANICAYMYVYMCVYIYPYLYIQGMWDEICNMKLLVITFCLALKEICWLEKRNNTTHKSV